MKDAFHIAAICLCAIAIVMHAGRMRKSGWSDLIATTIMFAAMLDIAYAHVLSAPLWTFALLITAMSLAALTSPRARRRRRGTGVTDAVPDSSLGLVAIAALLPLMHDVARPASSGHSGHGVGMGVLVVVALVVAGGHVIACVLASARKASASGRAHSLLMGASTIVMSAAIMA